MTRKIKKRRKITTPTKMARGLTGFGITTGIGSRVIGQVGGASSGYMQTQIGAGGLAGYTPVITSLGMGQYLIGQVRRVKKRVKKRKR